MVGIENAGEVETVFEAWSPGEVVAGVGLGFGIDIEVGDLIEWGIDTLC